MPHQPTPANLVDAVRGFLEDRALPELSGHTAFHARVAINALSIVLREMEMGKAHDQAEHQRLSVLLGQDAPLDDLRQLLSMRLDYGEIDLMSPALLAHLKATTMAHLAIDNPKYESYRRALAKHQ